VTIGAGESFAPDADADDDVVDRELVRAFMLTRGRTRASSPELAIETIVSASSALVPGAAVLDREQRRIRTLLAVPMSVAEVSAHLTIPLRAAVVLISEMVAAGTLSAGQTVDTSDTNMLLKIRSALQLL
jgi:hypothetical protein